MSQMSVGQSIQSVSIMASRRRVSTFLTAAHCLLQPTSIIYYKSTMRVKTALAVEHVQEYLWVGCEYVIVLFTRAADKIHFNEECVKYRNILISAVKLCQY